MNNTKLILQQVNKTHKGLEKYYLTALISVLGGRGVWLIGFQGMGKSVIGLSIMELLKKYIPIYTGDILTLHQIAQDTEFLSKNRLFIFVDDYSLSGTMYTKLSLLTTLTALNYKKNVRIRKKGLSADIEFDEFNYIVCLQPTWLNSIFNTEEFRNLFQDKTIRIYMFHLVKEAELGMPKVEVEINYDKSITTKEIPKNTYVNKSLQNLRYIYSEARAKETLLVLLNGILKLDGEFNKENMKLLYNISKLLKIENDLIEQFGEVKRIDLAKYRTLCILTKYKEFTADDFVKEFKISHDYAVQILATKSARQFVYFNNERYHAFPNPIVDLLNEKW